MHIGFDSRLPYYQLGGISQYILHLLPALAKLDRENHYTILHSRKDAKRYLPKQAKNFNAKEVWTPCHHRWEKWLLSLELLPERLDLLHSPDFIPPAYGARTRIITVHDLNFIYYPEFLTADSRRYYVDQIEWAVHVADHIIADSHYTRRDLIERLNVPEGKTTTVHLAASPVFMQKPQDNAVKSTLAKYRLKHGFILFVGTVSPRKNLKTLLKALSKLSNGAAVNVPLVLVGSKGWLYEDTFATIEKLNLWERVMHLQNVSNVQLSHLYRAAGLLALPSYYEGFGLPPLEAMHCGCPVIVSNRASLPEVVGSAGILLEPDDVDGWAEAILQVLSDSGMRQRLITEGHRQAQGFSWERTAAYTMKLYQKCLCES